MHWCIMCRQCRWTKVEHILKTIADNDLDGIKKILSFLSFNSVTSDRSRIRMRFNVNFQGGSFVDFHIKWL